MTPDTTRPFENFVSISRSNADRIRPIIDLAIRQKKDPSVYSHRPFAGMEMAMVFEKNSLRTRFSFEIAARQLGGNVLFVDQRGSQLGEREAIKDQAKVMSRYVDMIVLRTYSHAAINEFARYADVPVINALSDYSHPCQALADIMTVVEHSGSAQNVKICYVGDGNNVARSLAYAGKIMGATVVVCTPEGYALPDSDRTAVDGPGSIEYATDPLKAVQGADYVYADVWASMGMESEAIEREKIFAPYQVNEDLMALAGTDAKFMHCLPAHRGMEVTDAVVDSDASIVYDQAENRLHAQRALITMLLESD